MTRKEKLQDLQDTLYLAQLHFPRIVQRRVNVAYGEMDNIILLRDLIEDSRHLLTSEQKMLVDRLDDIIRRNSRYIWENLANPVENRKKLKTPRSRWWWYLDEIMTERVAS